MFVAALPRTTRPKRISPRMYLNAALRMRCGTRSTMPFSIVSTFELLAIWLPFDPTAQAMRDGRPDASHGPIPRRRARRGGPFIPGVEVPPDGWIFHQAH